MNGLAEAAETTEQSSDQPSRSAWQGWVGAFVALGCLATAGYAVVETFWG